MLSLDREHEREHEKTGGKDNRAGMSAAKIQNPPVEQLAFPACKPPLGQVPLSIKLTERPAAGDPRSGARRADRPLREPLVIACPSRRKTSAPCSLPSPGRRRMVHVAVSTLLLCVTVGSLIAVLPVGSDARGETYLAPFIRLVASRRNTTVLIAAQAATATAVTVDGYDPGGHEVFAGVQSAPASLPGSLSAADIGNLGRFFYGQCTYWSNMRYHQLTGHWVPWLGNAYQWAYAAPSYGWVISSLPNPNGPSIVVLAPYAEGSGPFGHVAVIEGATSSSSNGMMTSNWNWNGRWALLDWVRFYPGPGVSFIWYPGS